MKISNNINNENNNSEMWASKKCIVITTCRTILLHTTRYAACFSRFHTPFISFKASIGELLCSLCCSQAAKQPNSSFSTSPFLFIHILCIDARCGSGWLAIMHIGIFRILTNYRLTDSTESKRENTKLPYF